MRTLLISLSFLLVLAVTPVLAEPFVFAADSDLAPYSMFIDGAPAGIDVDLVKEAAKRAGVEVDIQLMPFESVLTSLRAGTSDGGFALFRTPEREAYAMYMEASPLHFSDYVLFTKVGGRFPYESLADLKGRIIGRVAGIRLGEAFEAGVASGEVEIKEYPDLSAGLRGLNSGEIDAYAGNIDVVFKRLGAMGMSSSIVYLPKKIVSQKPAYMVLSRASKNPDGERVMQRLERALDAMRKDGTYGAVARRYLFRF